VPAANLHVTVKFLGPVKASAVEAIRDRLARDLAARPPFELEARGLGAFPSPARARILWAGLAPSPGLAALADAVEGGMEALGFAREERAFHPHLTIARVKQGESGPAVAAALAERADLVFGSGRVVEAVLYESRTLPSGSEYVALARVGLGAPRARD
jgi:2'-5' RNA ligase